MTKKRKRDHDSDESFEPNPLDVDSDETSNQDNVQVEELENSQTFASNQAKQENISHAKFYFFNSADIDSMCSRKILLRTPNPVLFGTSLENVDFGSIHSNPLWSVINLQEYIQYFKTHKVMSSALKKLFACKSEKIDAIVSEINYVCLELEMNYLEKLKGIISILKDKNNVNISYNEKVYLLIHCSEIKLTLLQAYASTEEHLFYQARLTRFRERLINHFEKVVDNLNYLSRLPQFK